MRGDADVAPAAHIGTGDIIAAASCPFTLPFAVVGQARDADPAAAATSSALQDKVATTSVVGATRAGGWDDSAGILALPAKTLEAGFGPASVALIGSWAYMAVCALLIAEVNVNTLCALERSSVSMSSMARETVGEAGAIAASLAYAFIHYALLIAYMLEGGKLLAELVPASLPCRLLSRLRSACGHRRRRAARVEQWATIEIGEQRPLRRRHGLLRRLSSALGASGGVHADYLSTRHPVGRSAAGAAGDGAVVHLPQRGSDDRVPAGVRPAQDPHRHPRRLRHTSCHVPCVERSRAGSVPR